MKTSDACSRETRFFTAAKAAKDPDGPDGRTVNASEMKSALNILREDYLVTEQDATLARLEFAHAQKDTGAETAFRAFMGGASGMAPSKQKAVLKAWTRIGEEAGLVNVTQLPPNERFSRMWLKSDPGNDGQTWTALVPAGATNPSAPNPNKAKEFYVEVSGGLLPMTKVYGPIAIAPPNPQQWGLLHNPEVTAVNGSAMLHRDPHLVIKGLVGVNDEIAYKLKDLGRDGLEVTVGANKVRNGPEIEIMREDQQAVPISDRQLVWGETRPYVVKNSDGAEIARGDISRAFEIGMVAPPPER